MKIIRWALPLLAKYGYKKKSGQLVIRRSNFPLIMKKWRNYNVTQGWNVPYNDQNVKDLNYIYVDEISNPNEWIQITQHCGFNGV